ADEPVSSYRESFLSAVGRWMRKRRTLTASAAVALVLAVVGLSTFLVYSVRVQHQLKAAADQLRLEKEQTAAHRDNPDRWLERLVRTNRDFIATFSSQPLLQEPRLRDLRFRLLTSTREELLQIASESELLTAHPRIIALLAQTRLDLGTIYLVQG